MSKLLVAGPAIAMALALGSGCGEVSVGPTRAPSAVAKKSPYQFLRSKIESDGQDVMELYAFSGKFNRSRLIDFCRERKSKSTAKRFYYVVIFDDAGSAAFPKSPFTAAFGGEEDAMKHIRAIYEFNRINGFSELSYYDTNMWEGKATRVKF